MAMGVNYYMNLSEPKIVNPLGEVLIVKRPPQGLNLPNKPPR